MKAYPVVSAVGGDPAVVSLAESGSVSQLFLGQHKSKSNRSVTGAARRYKIGHNLRGKRMNIAWHKEKDGQDLNGKVRL